MVVAIYARAKNLTLKNCTFSHNSAINGSSIHNYGSNLVIEDCVFTNNSVSGNGGCVFNYEGTSKLIMPLSSTTMLMKKAEAFMTKIRYESN